MLSLFKLSSYFKPKKNINIISENNQNIQIELQQLTSDIEILSKNIELQTIRIKEYIANYSYNFPYKLSDLNINCINQSNINN